MKKWLVLLLLFACNYINAGETGIVKDTLKILYIGNSLTYTNDLPALVEEIGRQDGKKIISKSIALPDYSLEDHWNQGHAQDEIEKGAYDLVILQQGPSALPESQVLLIDHAKRFAKICREHDARMALYMVWPSRSRSFDLNNVILSYAKAAEKTGALLCPVGIAWKNVWQVNPGVSLYGPDGFHPGMDGTVLAAMTIYAAIAEKKDLDFLQHDKCSWKDQVDKNIHSLLSVTAATSVFRQ